MSTDLASALDNLREFGEFADGPFMARPGITPSEARLLLREIEGYRRALVAHHDLATLSDDVIREYDWRECPVCARARKQ